MTSNRCYNAQVFEKARILPDACERTGLASGGCDGTIHHRRRRWRGSGWRRTRCARASTHKATVLVPALLPNNHRQREDCTSCCDQPAGNPSRLEISKAEATLQKRGNSRQAMIFSETRMTVMVGLGLRSGCLDRDHVITLITLITLSRIQQPRRCEMQDTTHDRVRRLKLA